MTNKRLIEVNRIVKRIEDGLFSKSDINSLYVTLRNMTVNETIKDISNFYTHAEGRNQGLSYGVVKNYVEYILNEVQKGENQQVFITGHPPVFTSYGVLLELIKTLNEVGASFNEGKISSQSHMIIEYTKQLVDEGDYELKNPLITRCWIDRREGDTLFFNFTFGELEDNGPIKASGGTFATNLFD